MKSGGWFINLFSASVQSVTTGDLDIGSRLTITRISGAIILGKRIYINPTVYEGRFSLDHASELFFKPEFFDHWLRYFKDINVKICVSDCPNFSKESIKTMNYYAKLSVWQRIVLRFRFNIGVIFKKEFWMWLINIIVAIIATIAAFKIA
jgi:ribosomal protein L30E